MNPLTPTREPVVWKSSNPQHNPVSEWLAWIVAGTVNGIVPIPAQEPQK